MRPVSWGNWEYLDTYNHCIAVLQRYFTGIHPLTERDARIYSHYLQTEHKRLCSWLKNWLPTAEYIQKAGFQQ